MQDYELLDPFVIAADSLDEVSAVRDSLESERNEIHSCGCLTGIKGLDHTSACIQAGLF